MKQAEKAGLLPHAMEIFYSCAAMCWVLLPLLLKNPGNIVPLMLPFELYPKADTQLVSLILACFAVYLIPLIALWKVAAFFLRDKISFIADSNKVPAIVMNIVWTALVIVALCMHAIKYAGGAEYFAGRSVLTWAMLALSVAGNVYSVVRLIKNISRRDPSFQEYVEFRESSGEMQKGIIAAVKRTGIQRRLTISFVSIIFLIIIILSGVLMRDFSNTILGAVIANGKALAERTASIVKANVGDTIAVDDYLSIESKKNDSSVFPFLSVSYMNRNAKNDSIAVAASTDLKRVDKKVPDQKYRPEETAYRNETKGDLIVFVSPVKLGGVYLGYVSVEYDRHVIYEPYFRTQVKVFIIALLFIYASTFLTYLFGRTIVFPILFLRMSVNAIASLLTSMIKGTIKISPELLTYRDRVETRDEIKKLSLEIGNMTTVIRGVVPYISASTLKHSESGAPSSVNRDLCFLFTDIRGFTTFCEGKTPDEVVQMLNHFLELQTSAIIAAGGDIDKFVGDEIMAMFEGPQKELKACKAAMNIRKLMAEEREKASKSDSKAIEIGIGINTGPVVFGSVGAISRMDFTSIGDTVNLAARLEGVNKQYGTKALISGAVHELVSGEYLCREIDLLTVKGKSEPVRIYEILQIEAKASARLKKMKEVFEQGLDFYRRQKWASATKAFEALIKNMEDGASQTFLRRIEHFKRVAPPENWDGVWNLTDK